MNFRPEVIMGSRRGHLSRSGVGRNLILHTSLIPALGILTLRLLKCMGQDVPPPVRADCVDQPPSVIATLADGSLPDCASVAAAGICTSEGGARALAEENCCASCSPTVCEAGTAGVNTTTQSQVSTFVGLVCAHLSCEKSELFVAACLAAVYNLRTGKVCPCKISILQRLPYRYVQPVVRRDER